MRTKVTDGYRGGRSGGRGKPDRRFSPIPVHGHFRSFQISRVLKPFGSRCTKRLFFRHSFATSPPPHAVNQKKATILFINNFIWMAVTVFENEGDSSAIGTQNDWNWNDDGTIIRPTEANHTDPASSGRYQIIRTQSSRQLDSNLQSCKLPPTRR